MRKACARRLQTEKGRGMKSGAVAKVIILLAAFVWLLRADLFPLSLARSQASAEWGLDSD